MDERLRQAERRWRASGALDDEVALLSVRLRLGELSPAALDLAAHLGHAAASALVGEPPRAQPPDLERLVLGLTPWAPAAWARAAAAGARAALGAWTRHADLDPAVTAALEGAECPAGRAPAEGEGLAAGVARVIGHDLPPAGDARVPSTAFDAGRYAWSPLWRDQPPPHPRGPYLVGSAAMAAAGLWSRAATRGEGLALAVDALHCAALALSGDQARVRRAVLEDLPRWALGLLGPCPCARCAAASVADRVRLAFADDPERAQVLIERRASLDDARRAWRDRVAVAQEEARLVAALAGGALSRDELRLAVHLGHEVAAAVLADDAASARDVDGARDAVDGAPDASAGDAPTWAGGLAAFGQAACVRALVALAVPGREQERALAVGPRAKTADGLRAAADLRCLEAAEAWLAAVPVPAPVSLPVPDGPGGRPADAIARDARPRDAIARDASPRAEATPPPGPRAVAAREAARAAVAQAELAASPGADPSAARLAAVAVIASTASEAAAALSRAIGARGDEAARAVIAAALMPARLRREPASAAAVAAEVVELPAALSRDEAVALGAAAFTATPAAPAGATLASGRRARRAATRAAAPRARDGGPTSAPGVVVDREALAALAARFHAGRSSQGPLEDEAAWLRARLEAGLLDPARLAVAHLCGHPAAARVVALRGPTLHGAFEVARAAGLSPARLHAWREGGCPAARRAGRWHHDLAAVVAWRRAQAWPDDHGPLLLLAGALGLVAPLAAARAALAAARVVEAQAGEAAPEVAHALALAAHLLDPTTCAEPGDGPRRRDARPHGLVVDGATLGGIPRPPPAPPDDGVLDDDLDDGDLGLDDDGLVEPPPPPPEPLASDALRPEDAWRLAHAAAAFALDAARDPAELAHARSALGAAYGALIASCPPFDRAGRFDTAWSALLTRVRAEVVPWALQA